MEINSEHRSGIRRFLSGLAWFLAAIGIIVGVVAIAQREVPMKSLDPEWAAAYSYWSVFRFSGPLSMLSFLLMLGCLAQASFRRGDVQSERLNWTGLLPLILGSSMGFLLLTGGWCATINGGLDADIGTRYSILESKLLLLAGATSSLLCFLITRLRLRFAESTNP